MATLTTSRLRKRHKARESGQAAVFLVLAMGIFLVGGIGFVVDGANLWFHRQSAQTAADAACTAGAMDLLSTAAGASLPNASDWIGNSFLCSGTTGGGSNPTSNSTFPPCQYAGFNGYSGSGLQGIQVSFPASGSVSAAATCPTALPYSSSLPVCAADDDASTPYMQLQVTDRVPTTFIRLLGAGPSTTVPAKSTCGLSNVLSAVPILVLNPNAPTSGAANTITADSGSSLTVFGGSQKSIQVNSSDPAAVDLSSATVDLSQANGGNGGNFAVVTRESLSDANVTLANANSHWVNAAGLTADPFAMIEAPAQPATNGSFIPHSSCPGYDSSVSCDEYQPGYYPATVNCNSVMVSICIGKNHDTLALFDPGIYYLDGDFATVSSGHDTCVRPATGIGGGIGGTLFYLHGSSSVNISQNSGQMIVKLPGNNVVFSCASPTYGVQLSSLTCISNVPTGVTTLTGNVLLGPCTGLYGDPLGAGIERGLLFFHDRDVQPTIPPSWSSAVSFGLVGSLYFHNCSSTTANGSGVNCDPTAFTETLTLSSGANAYIIGNIAADQLHLAGNSAITVSLSPKAEYYTLKASLLQ
jgi:putative Flp pilus-assembly TadE/G-like protein